MNAEIPPPTPSTASALKARLSARKPRQYPPAPSVISPLPVRFLVQPHEQYALAKSLSKIDKARARRVLSALAVESPEATETAEFWAACLEIERGNAKRTASCFLLALEKCRGKDREMRMLVDSLLVDYFLGIAASPSPRKSPNNSKGLHSLEQTLERMILQDGGKSLAASPVAQQKTEEEFVPPATAVAEQQQQQQQEEFVPPCPASPVLEDDSWWQQQEEDEAEPAVTTTPPRQSLKSFLGSPATRVPLEQAENLTPKHNQQLPRLTPTRGKLNTPTAAGLVVVLSPVRESRTSEVKVATPVRRSTRTNSIDSVDDRNRDALIQCNFVYAPNPALMELDTSQELGTEDGEQQPQQPAKCVQRRSQRKTKRVDWY